MHQPDAFDVELVRRTRRMLATGRPRFSVQALGRELHVPRSTIYRRWPSASVLVGAALSQALDEALSEPPKLAAKAAEVRLAEAWSRIAAFASSAEGRTVARVIADDDPAQGPGARMLRRHLAAYRADLVELFHETTSGQSASDADLESAADLSFSSAWCGAFVAATSDSDAHMLPTDVILRGITAPSDTRIYGSAGISS